MRSFRQALEQGHAIERDWVTAAKRDGLSVAHGLRVVRDQYVPGSRVQNPDAVGLIRIETKGRSLVFTSPEDYPYPTAFVGNAANMAADITQPLITVLISRPTRCWVWVLATDRDETWTIEQVSDSTRGSLVSTLVCPKSFLRPSESLTPYLLHHDLLGSVAGDTSAFGPDPGAGEVDPRPEARNQKADRKAR